MSWVERSKFRRDILTGMNARKKTTVRGTFDVALQRGI